MWLIQQFFVLNLLDIIFLRTAPHRTVEGYKIKNYCHCAIGLAKDHRGQLTNPLETYWQVVEINSWKSAQLTYKQTHEWTNTGHNKEWLQMKNAGLVEIRCGCGQKILETIGNKNWWGKTSMECNSIHKM